MAAIISRRSALAGSLGILLHAHSAGKEPPTSLVPDCPRCGGFGRIPLKDARPWIWIEPAAAPKWDSIIGEQPCPICQSDTTAAKIAQELQECFETAQENHRRWEQRTGWKLTLAITRHATLHSQLTTAQTRAAATALEALTMHLKRLTGSLALATTRPDTLELMLLLEKSSWDAFRNVLEGLYTREQLGEAWAPVRDLNAYDHPAIPHLYETPQTIRIRPPSCGATFIVARRQLNLAAGSSAPFWLAEGFAAYGDYIVHKLNRWYTTYAGESVPPGDWMASAKQLAADSMHRDWSDFFRRELRDWEPRDHFQSMAVVAFLLESEPARFLDYLRRLKSGDQPPLALESAYSAPIKDLEDRWLRWILARR